MAHMTIDKGLCHGPVEVLSLGSVSCRPARSMDSSSCGSTGMQRAHAGCVGYVMEINIHCRSSIPVTKGDRV